MIGSLNAWVTRACERAHGLGVPVSVSVKVTEPQHVGGAHVLDLDGTKVIGQLIIWPSGAVEVSALAVETAEQVFFRDANAQQISDLDLVFEELSRVVARVETQG